MSWADVIATGIGGDGVEFRLVVEGCPVEFVTTARMAGDCIELGQEGKRRVSGLLREGLGFTESVYLAGAELDVGISPARIVETPGRDVDAATEAFTREPRTVAWLLTTLGESGDLAVVRDDSEIEIGAHYHIGTEVVRVVNYLDHEVEIERGRWRTTPQRHHTDGTDGTPVIRALTVAPLTWIGRRTWLYAHGADELGVGDTGTLIAQGVIGSDPQLEGGDATTWLLNLQSRWTILEQEIGAGNDDPRTLAGIYYPGNRAFRIAVNRASGATNTGASEIGPRFHLAGFFRSNEDWALYVAETLNADATIASWGWVFLPSVDSRGRWQLHVRIVGATAYYPQIWGGSPLDGEFDGRVRSLDFDREVGQVDPGGAYVVSWGPGIFREAVPPDELRRVPRSLNTSLRDEVFADDPAALANFPETRIYLNSVRGLLADSSITFSQREPEGGGDAPEPHTTLIFSVDTSAGSVTCGSPPQLIAVGEWTQEITVTTHIRPLSLSPLAPFTLAGFRDRLIALGPRDANNGTIPLVTADDLASWTEVVEGIAATAADVYRTRRYIFGTGVRLTDVLVHDARLLGAFFHLDAEGRIAIRPLTIDTQPLSADYDLSDEDGTILTDDGFGELTSGNDGNVNVVEIHRGYDPIEDKWTRGTIRVRDVEGMSNARKERVIEIKPRSTSRRVEIDQELAQQLAAPVRALFSGRIIHHTFSVPLSRFHVLVGDTVRVTSSTLPYDGARRVNAGGTRGMYRVRGVVVARDWSDISSGRGKLTVLISSRMAEVGGYAPSARIASASGSGTSWTLELEANRYAPAGRTDAEYFEVGDVVHLRQWDVDTPTTRTGTVTSVSGNSVAVALTASWSGLGGATYELGFANANVVQEDQRAYVFIGNSAARVDDGGAGRNARTFAP